MISGTNAHFCPQARFRCKIKCHTPEDDWPREPIAESALRKSGLTEAEAAAYLRSEARRPRAEYCPAGTPLPPVDRQACLLADRWPRFPWDWH